MPQDDDQGFANLEPTFDGLGGPDQPLRVAIVGSGPSGFYAAEALFKSDANVRVTMFEKFPTPFGLVRFGVAPDHSKIRNVVKTFEKTAGDERFSFCGNVTIGKDITVEELHTFFDAIVLAFGAQSDRSLGIPGEDLRRSYTATAFCAWYNGHPDYRDRRFTLESESAVVIGVGNVAADVARILVTPPDELAGTDMATHAVEALRQSKVRTVHLVGRRGPVQMKFTPKEMGELADIDGCDLIVDPADLELGEADKAELALPDRTQAQKNFEILKAAAERGDTGAPKKIVLHFLKSPIELRGHEAVEQVVLEHNALKGEPGNQWPEGTGKTETLDCGLLFRSVGYRGVRLPGVPFDDKKGVVPNESGRVTGGRGLYVAGWIKRGPSGLIGTNKADSAETVLQLLDDISGLAVAEHRSDDELAKLLADRGVRVVTFDDWRKIDAAERQRGEAVGKPRDNFTNVDEMLAVLG